MNKDIYFIHSEMDLINFSAKLPDSRYEEIKEEIGIFLSKYGKRKIPVDVFALSKELGIRLVKYSEILESEWEVLERLGIPKNSDGFLAIGIKNGKETSYIYYNDEKPKKRIRFTILHEIGHLVLGHTQASLNAEAEANFFAKYLIAPPVLVDLIKPTDFMQIADKFELSSECAMYSFNFYQKWLGVNKYKNQGFYTEYEKIILNIFAEAVAC